MDSMNMTSSSNSTSPDMSTSMMMKAYLHFTPGDALIFESIVPTSAGAVFGACLIFFLISVGDRYLRAACRGFEREFSQRTQRLARTYHFTEAADNSDSKASGDSEAHSPAAPAPARFILSHELSRGFLAGLQSTLHYLLMLVVMTFNASYIISVILGVVVGEVAFGRMNH
ncbi:Ctr copper transporter [Mycena metata]|uniref:Copper transport protein n=1 Tax=Mycena metata TaxID=1033252 RepID=A0AAD7I1M7_9AGAR|nr:Ctr copper transporter [Mycena metata]